MNAGTVPPPPSGSRTVLVVGLGRVASGHAAGLVLPPELEILRPVGNSAESESWLRLANAEAIWRQVAEVPEATGYVTAAPAPSAPDDASGSGLKPCPPLALARLRGWAHDGTLPATLALRCEAWLVSARHHGCTGLLPATVLAILARQEGTAQELSAVARPLLAHDAVRLAWLAVAARPAAGRTSDTVTAGSAGADEPEGDAASFLAAADPLGPRAARRFKATRDDTKRVAPVPGGVGRRPADGRCLAARGLAQAAQYASRAETGCTCCGPCRCSQPTVPKRWPRADAFLAEALAVPDSPVGRQQRAQVFHLRASLAGIPWRRGVEDRLAAWLRLAPVAGVGASLSRLKGWFKGSAASEPGSAESLLGLDLAPPAVFDPAWVTDGFDEDLADASTTPAQRPGYLFPTGPLDWLAQHIMALPPSVVAARLGLTPQLLDEAIERGPLKPAERGRLRHAFAASARRHADLAGAESAIAHWLAQDGQPTGVHPSTLAALLSYLPAARAAEVVTRVLGWPIARNESGEDGKPGSDALWEHLDGLAKALLQTPLTATPEEITAFMSLATRTFAQARFKQEGWASLGLELLKKSPWLPPPEAGHMLVLVEASHPVATDGTPDTNAAAYDRWLRTGPASGALDALRQRPVIDRDFATAGALPVVPIVSFPPATDGRPP